MVLWETAFGLFIARQEKGLPRKSQKDLLKNRINDCLYLPFQNVPFKLLLWRSTQKKKKKQPQDDCRCSGWPRKLSRADGKEKSSLLKYLAEAEESLGRKAEQQRASAGNSGAQRRRFLSRLGCISANGNLGRANGVLSTGNYREILLHHALPSGRWRQMYSAASQSFILFLLLDSPDILIMFSLLRFFSL